MVAILRNRTQVFPYKRDALTVKLHRHTAYPTEVWWLVIGGVGYAFKQMDDILSVIRAKWHVKELHLVIGGGWWLTCLTRPSVP